MSGNAQITQTPHPYVVCVEGICGGRPIIKGTRMPVSALAHYYRSGMSVDEILDAFPFLMPAQVHGALSYYYDNIEQIDNEIALSQDESYWMTKYPPGRLSKSSPSDSAQRPAQTQPARSENT